MIQLHAAWVWDGIEDALDVARRLPHFAHTRAPHDRDSLSSFRKYDLRQTAHCSMIATSIAISSNLANACSNVIFFLLAHGPLSTPLMSGDAPVC
jgi:hypothetical protein